MIKLPNQSFEFTTENLSYSSVEENILNYYDLGYADSSNFMELPEGRSSSHNIRGTNGIIEFSAHAFKGNDGLYHVTCYPSNVKKNR